jgi:hypothetical protein
MCKIGDVVNVSFNGVMEMEEIVRKGHNVDFPDDLRMCRVTFTMPDGRFCIAIVAKEFITTTLVKKELK